MYFNVGTSPVFFYCVLNQFFYRTYLHALTSSSLFLMFGISQVCKVSIFALS